MELQTATAVEAFREGFSMIFFSTAVVVVSLAASLKLVKLRPWCSCAICKAYVSGSWREDFENMCDWYTDLLRRSPTGTIHIHVLGNIITVNPTNIEHMLRTRFENYPKGKQFSAILGDLLGRGIFNVDGEQWLFQRKLASLELGSHSVRSYAFEIVSGEVRSRLLPLLNSVADRCAALDLQDMFRRFSFDNICKISFGLDPGCLELSLPRSEIEAAFDLASRLSARRATTAWPIVWKAKRFFNCGSERDLKHAVKFVDMLAGEVIRQRRKLGPTDGQHDLLSRFIDTIDDDRYLRDIVISFLLAGRDTVAAGLTSLFYLLACHPHVLEAMRDEISLAKCRFSGDDDYLLNYEQLRSSHYVHAVLYESMRLYPPVQFDSKFCAADDVLPDGTFVQRGTRLTYHPYAMGRMENVWGLDSNEFKPERWLCDGVFSPESPFKYPVFQAGTRVCLGKEMALMEMTAVAVAVVHHFDIEVVDKTRKPKFAPGLTATFGGGLHVTVRKRVNNNVLGGGAS